MIKVDEMDPVGEMEPSFPYRDVTIKRGVDVKTFYDLDGEIGRGKFGTVYKCREKGTNLTLAAKFVGIARRQDRRNVEREVEIMRTLQHPRLIQLYDAFETDNVMCVVLELIDGGELFERVIDDDFILTEKACTVFMRQICEGVDFIHRNNIIHLDLKPENILCLTKTGNRIKIIDFGLARKFEPDKKLQVLFGTPEFVAPEVVNFDQISCATDMWSVGVICYVLLSGLSPFMGETDVETMANVTVARYDFEDESFEDISPEAKDFISKLLLKDKGARLTAVECLSHPWLRRKIPPPPPSLDNTKENLRTYVDKCIPNLKNSILIENSLKEKPGFIETIIENEHKTVYPHLNVNPKKEISVLTNPKLQELFDCSKDNSPFLKSINTSFKEIGNRINSQKVDSNIIKQNAHEINIKKKDSHSTSQANNPQTSNPIINKNICIKNDLNAQENPENINRENKQQEVVLKGSTSEKAIMKNNSIIKSEIIENTLKNNKDVKNPSLLNEVKFHTPELSKDNTQLNTNIIRPNHTEPIVGTSTLQSKLIKQGHFIKNNELLIEESLVGHSLGGKQEDKSWFKQPPNSNTLVSPILLAQNTKDDIKITINSYKTEESVKLFDFSQVSEFIQKSSMKITENDKIPSLHLTETLKEVTKMREAEPLPFKQHLKSNPPWFSELNNQHLKKPLTDVSERRSSDFSCYLNSKDDSASLNLADEIRKLSARLLQMSSSQNQNAGNYTSNNLNSHSRNDPITCFLENHGISQPRPKYKFSNLNRDVPIGSPPPPSNIAYYLNKMSNVDRNDSYSAPGSPRTSPERTNKCTDKSLETSTEMSSFCDEKEPIEHSTQCTTEGNAVKTVISGDQLKKQI